MTGDSRPREVMAGCRVTWHDQAPAEFPHSAGASFPVGRLSCSMADWLKAAGRRMPSELTDDMGASAERIEKA